MHPITLLNSPVLTEPGAYRMYRVTTEDAGHLVHSQGFASAIGHEATARLISGLLNIECPVARQTYRQAVGEQALVFRLDRRMPEGEVVHSLAALEAIGYSWAVLERTK